MDYLPSTTDGYLPIFVLLVGVTAITNALQCYNDISYLQRVYAPPTPLHNTGIKTTKVTQTVILDTSAPADQRRPSVTSIVAAGVESPVTPLSARTFGTWNVAVGIVRLIAAYHLNERSWYTMSMLTNVIGLVHFGLEAFVYKTAKPSGPWLAPTLTALAGLSWHVMQFDHYVK